MLPTSLVRVPCAVLALIACALATPAHADVRLLAAEGFPAAGFSEDFLYRTVENPVIGRSGHVAFTGDADVSLGSTPANTPAVWAGPPDAIGVIVRRNDPIDGLPGNVLFDSAPLPRTVVTKSGRVAFLARLRGAVQTNATDAAILVHDGDVVRSVLRGGDPAPGFPAGHTILQDSLRFALSDAGMVIVGLTSLGGQALWFWDFASFERIAASGTAVGASLPGCTYLLLGQSFDVDDAGDVVFEAGTLFGAGCPTTSSIFLWNGGVQTRLVSVFDPVPGMSGTVFNAFVGFFAELGEDGDVSFGAQLRNPTTAAQARSFWVARAGGGLELAAIAGETLPGAPTEILGAGVGALLGAWSIVGSGLGTLRAEWTSVSSIVAGLPRASQPYTAPDAVAGETQLEILALRGEQPPGFGPTWFFEEFEGPSINDAGAVAFGASIADATDVAGTRRTTIWRSTPADDLELIASEGMAVDAFGTPAAIDTIASTTTSLLSADGESSHGGQPSQWSDGGQYVFRGSLAGTFPNAIFLAPAFAVPELGAAASSSAALVVLLQLRRARQRPPGKSPAGRRRP